MFVSFYKAKFACPENRVRLRGFCALDGTWRVICPGLQCSLMLKDCCSSTNIALHPYSYDKEMLKSALDFVVKILEQHLLRS